MNIKHIKLIYKYMKEAGWRIGGFGTLYRNSVENDHDSNSVYDCVREMERNGDWKSFKLFFRAVWESLILSANGTIESWIMNPETFFNYMGMWLEERSKKMNCVGDYLTIIKSDLPKVQRDIALDGLLELFNKKEAQLLLRLKSKEKLTDSMNNFYKKHKQWFIDYPKVIQKDKFSDDLIDLFLGREES